MNIWKNKKYWFLCVIAEKDKLKEVITPYNVVVRTHGVRRKGLFSYGDFPTLFETKNEALEYKKMFEDRNKKDLIFVQEIDLSNVKR